MIVPKNVMSGISFGITTLVITCNICKEDKVIELTNKEYRDYFIERKHINKCMSRHSDDVRELCMSGICGKCFDELFKDDRNE